MIKLNGETRAVNAATITELISELRLIPETLLVEHNGVALHRAEWNFAAVHDGDVIEFVRVVAGG